MAFHRSQIPYEESLSMLSQLIRLTAFLICFGAGSTHALTADEANAMTTGDTDARVEALGKAMSSADEKTAAFMQALSDDAVKLVGGRAFIARGDRATDPVTHAEFVAPEGAEDVINNNRMRGELDSAMAALKLFSKDDAVRLAAAGQLQRDADESKLPRLSDRVRSIPRGSAPPSRSMSSRRARSARASPAGARAAGR